MQLVKNHMDGLPQGSWSLKLWYDRIWESGDYGGSGS